LQKSTSPLSKLSDRVSGWQHRRLIARLARDVQEHAAPKPGEAPVLVFNASTRLLGLSLNAAFSLLTAWGLRLAGVPVVHYVCRSGLCPCVLGTNREDHTTPPPCDPCIAQSRRLYAGAEVRWFGFQEDPQLAGVLTGLGIEELAGFIYDPAQESSQPSHPYPHHPIPLGSLVLPSIRWALRRHTLPDDEPTRYLLRQYLLSAYSIAQDFAATLTEIKPQAAVIFNGVMYPEATARWVARQMGVRTVAHEVGFQQYSAFFTEGEPTAYPILIPESFELDERQNARLDAYLEKRFQGKFTMAGIQFWPEMRGLDAAFLERAAQFNQIVPVFTNVVYDTSQVHANTVFSNMFAWLDLVLEIMRRHPQTLFVVRAHPDEMRPGTRKLSNESVRQWVKENGVDRLPNVVFIDSQEYLSSYELIQRAAFVIVYNSSIGMEAALLGKTVVCGGKARYTQYPMVHFPQSPEEFKSGVEEFLAGNNLTPPPEFRRNARRFLYHQLYRVSIPLSDYIQAAPRMGFVQMKDFSWEQLQAANSPSMRILVDGIQARKPFLLPED
jgi:hypothetical protein